MAKTKSRIPLGDTSGSKLNNPFASLAGVQVTNTNTPPAPNGGQNDEPNPTPRKIGKFAVQVERKGRGGKTVTLVRNLGLSHEALQTLAKDMRHALGCGASVQDDALVLQGDQSERARAYLTKMRDT